MIPDCVLRCPAIVFCVLLGSSPNKIGKDRYDSWFALVLKLDDGKDVYRGIRIVERDNCGWRNGLDPDRASDDFD